MRCRSAKCERARDDLVLSISHPGGRRFESIERAGGRAIAVQMDVSSEDDVVRAFAAAADYVVGSTIFVDGGMTLYPRFE
jgi:NAD(P)-dependent dehydrogenase (short-subunit alcohol dehydrogenase family)